MNKKEVVQLVDPRILVIHLTQLYNIC